MCFPVGKAVGSTGTLSLDTVQDVISCSDAKTSEHVPWHTEISVNMSRSLRSIHKHVRVRPSTVKSMSAGSTEHATVTERASPTANNAALEHPHQWNAAIVVEGYTYPHVLVHSSLPLSCPDDRCRRFGEGAVDSHRIATRPKPARSLREGLLFHNSLQTIRTSTLPKPSIL